MQLKPYNDKSTSANNRRTPIKKAGIFCYSKLTCYAFLFFLTVSIKGFSQNKNINNKVDPYFKSLIELNKSAQSKPGKKCWFKRKDKAGSTARIKEATKEYECIVYTKNAQALREKGITLNSILPTFVTAVATIDEILLMASMDEVTYINKPGEDQLHQQQRDNNSSND